jgi:hypothetical protein
MIRDRVRIGVDQLLRGRARELDEVDVLLQVGEAQQRRAALAGAQVLSRAAQERSWRAISKPSLFS